MGELGPLPKISVLPAGPLTHLDLGAFICSLRKPFVGPARGKQFPEALPLPLHAPQGVLRQQLGLETSLPGLLQTRAAELQSREAFGELGRRPWVGLQGIHFPPDSRRN